jgi:hypothetical protein
MADKLPLPEWIVTANGKNHNIIDDAILAVDKVHMGKKIKLEEEIARKNILTSAITIAKEQADRNIFVGIIHLKNEKIPVPVRIEYRLPSNNGALDISEEPILDHHFGKDWKALFERATVIEDIIDPQALINILQAAGLNPWDYVTLGIIKDKDEIIIAHFKGDDPAKKGFTTAQAFLPKEGFLNNLNKLAHLLSKAALIYIREYIDKTFKPTVIIGSTKSSKGD